MRFWREFKEPALKCERLGHKIVQEWRTGHAYPPADYRESIADWVRQERQVCSRCGFVEVPWTTRERTPLHGVTMPMDRFLRLRRDGFV